MGGMNAQKNFMRPFRHFDCDFKSMIDKCYKQRKYKKKQPSKPKFEFLVNEVMSYRKKIALILEPAVRSAVPGVSPGRELLISH